MIRSLYHDLQDLSANEVQSSGQADTELELETLPTSLIASGKPSAVTSGSKASLHSVLSRSLFSASFSESCVMLLMLMAQGVDLFRPRYVVLPPGGYAELIQKRARLFNWKMSLFALLAIILLFIPVSLSVVLTFRPASQSGAPIVCQTCISK